MKFCRCFSRHPMNSPSIHQEVVSTHCTQGSRPTTYRRHFRRLTALSNIIFIHYFRPVTGTIFEKRFEMQTEIYDYILLTSLLCLASLVAWTVTER